MTPEAKARQLINQKLERAGWLIQDLRQLDLSAGTGVTHYLRRRGRNLRNLLIVGSNSRAVAVADSLLSDKNFGYQLVGFADDHWHFEMHRRS